MKFSTIHQRIMAGAAVRREGWNGKNQFVFLIKENVMNVPVPGAAKMGIKKGAKIKPVLALHNAQGEIQPGWVPSQGDLTAEDWVVC